MTTTKTVEIIDGPNSEMLFEALKHSKSKGGFKVKFIGEVTEMTDSDCKATSSYNLVAQVTGLAYTNGKANSFVVRAVFDNLPGSYRGFVKFHYNTGSRTGWINLG